MKNFILRNREILSQSNYIRKADPKRDYWLDFSRNRVRQFYKEFGDKFNIIVAGDPELEGDFFVIPYPALKSVLKDEFLSNDKNGKTRWIGKIRNFQLKIHICQDPLDISLFYGNPEIINTEFKHLEYGEESEKSNEFAIQNRMAEVSARQKQSVFRRKVLSNFENRCCITGIAEDSLLVASHIVPWAAKIDSRLDPGNGLCLSALYDRLFDRGFITLEDDLKVTTTSKKGGFSLPLQKVLNDLERLEIKAESPKKHKLENSYLEYHRDVIFIR